MDTTPNENNRIKPPSGPVCESNKPNRKRRSIFVFGGTLLFTALAAYATFTLDPDNVIAKIFIQGCLGIVELIVISYLFTTTVDRSEVLTNIGRGVRDYGYGNRRINRYGYGGGGYHYDYNDRPFNNPEDGRDGTEESKG